MHRTAIQRRRRNGIGVELINPPGLLEPQGYVQMSVATGSRTVYLAGQVARDADGRRVGAGDLAGQVSQAYLNVNAGLAAVGATFGDVARLTVYVVDWKPEKMAALLNGVVQIADQLSGDPVRPVTLIGMAALGEPDLLVEVEATAVLD